MDWEAPQGSEKKNSHNSQVIGEQNLNPGHSRARDPAGSRVLAICLAAHAHSFNPSDIPVFSLFYFSATTATLWPSISASSTPAMLATNRLSLHVSHSNFRKVNSIKGASEGLPGFERPSLEERMPQTTSGFRCWSQIQSSKHWDA